MPVPLILIGGGLVLSGGLALLRAINRRKANTVSQKSSPEKEVKHQTLDDFHKLLSQKHNKAINQNLVVSGIAMGLTGFAKLFYNPLCWLSLPFIVFSLISIFNDMLDDLLVKRQLGSSAIDSIAIVATLASGFYFISAYMSGLYFLGQKLLLKTSNYSASDFSERLPGLQSDKVWLWQDGIEVESVYDSVKVGNIVVVNTGEIILFDGIIESGSGTIDLHMLRGMAEPYEVAVGDDVLAMTLLTSGKLHIRVEKTGSDTLAAQMSRVQDQTTDFNTSVALSYVTTADLLALPTFVLSGIVLGTLGPISAVTVINSNFSSAVLVFAPLGVLNYQKLASQQGILIKDGRSLELLSQVDTIVFDKSSLLSSRQLEIKQIFSWQDIDTQGILRLAATAEQKQPHPVARAIRQAASAAGITLPEGDHTGHDSEYDSGYNLGVTIEGKLVLAGSLGFMTRQSMTIPEAAEQIDKDCLLSGNSVLFIAVDGNISGAIELQANLCPEAENTVRALQKRGLNISIVSSDHEKSTQKIAKALAIENVFVDMLPEDKAAYIERLQKEGKSVCFIGDGVNDSVAMKKVQVSVSLSGASAAATNIANVVMMENSLEKLGGLLDFSADFNKDMKTNVALALGPGVLGIAALMLFRINIYSVMSLYTLTLGLGAINTVLPLLRTRKILILGNNYNQQDRKELAEQADKIIGKYAFDSGLTGFIPVPMLDIMGVMSVQRIMLYRLTVLYGIPFTENLAKALLITMMGKVASGITAPVASSALKLVPGIGTLVGGAGMATLGRASTYAIGKVFQEHFDQGGTLEDFDPDKVKDTLDAELEKGKELSDGEGA